LMPRRRQSYALFPAIVKGTQPITQRTAVHFALASSWLECR
jgi:hypothetical protein